jgi:hypothetical protein
LAIKHAILDASILEQGNSSARQVARVLRIHHHNVSKAVVRREVLHTAGDFLFSLSVRTNRVDGLGLDEKQIIIKWWISETRVSPNKKDVTRKRISASVRDEKPTHYLQETYVWQSRLPSFLILSANTELIEGLYGDLVTHVRSIVHIHL